MITLTRYKCFIQHLKIEKAPEPFAYFYTCIQLGKVERAGKEKAMGSFEA